MAKGICCYLYLLEVEGCGDNAYCSSKNQFDTKRKQKVKKLKRRRKKKKFGASVVEETISVNSASWFSSS